MPRLLALGHVTRDEAPDGDRLGGSVSYAALCAARLGWQAAIATSAGADVHPARELPGIAVFGRPAAVTTRFRNAYAADGGRRQTLLARADAVELGAVPEAWRSPDVLLLAPVAAELPPRAAAAFDAALVGALGQGYLRAVAADGRVTQRRWADPAADLAGVDVLVLSLEDVGGRPEAARALLDQVPLVALTRGRDGVDLLTRDAADARVPTWPRDEVDPTGAGDVFGAAFLTRYHAARDARGAARFACAAASCVVERPGLDGVPDRAAVERRMREPAAPGGRG